MSTNLSLLRLSLLDYPDSSEVSCSSEVSTSSNSDINLPKEGTFFNLSNEEMHKITRGQLSQNELQICDKAKGIVKISSKKEEIFALFEQYGEIRCRSAWVFYRDIFFDTLTKYWESLKEGERIFTFKFITYIYTNINDTMVYMLGGTPYELKYRCNKIQIMKNHEFGNIA